MRNFDKFCDYLIEYQEKYHDLLVPYSYTIRGYKLGVKVSGTRLGQCRLSEEEIEKLNSIGFVWKVKKSKTKFEDVYDLILEYIKIHGNCEIKQNYVTESGINLGTIVANIRSGARKITEEEKKQLEDIGFRFTSSKPKVLPFEEVYELLSQYFQKHGNIDMLVRYTTEEGVHLGVILYDIQRHKRKITPEQEKQLEKLGFH